MGFAFAAADPHHVYGLKTSLGTGCEQMTKTVVVPFLAFVVLVVDVEAGSVLTATCESPKGLRIDYGMDIQTLDPNKLEFSQDSFTGVKPVFIVDGDKKTMLVIWGNTEPPGIPEALVRPPGAKEYAIVHWSLDQITAVESNSNGVWVYSLYPKLRYGIFTRQTHWTGGGHLIGVVYHSKCRFAK